MPSRFVTSLTYGMKHLCNSLVILRTNTSQTDVRQVYFSCETPLNEILNTQGDTPAALLNTALKHNNTNDQ